MRTTVIVFFALVLACTCDVHAALEEHYEERPIKIKKADFFQEENHVVISVGSKVTMKISIFEGEFFGSAIINANAKMKNTTGDKVQAVYAISFHDKDGKLVGCHQGNWDMEPNEEVNYGSGLINAETQAIATVTSYKLKVWVIPSTKKD